MHIHLKRGLNSGRDESQDTGSYEILDIIGEVSGRFILPGQDALRGEIRKWQEEGKKARCEVRKRELLLDELEGRIGNNGKNR